MYFTHRLLIVSLILFCIGCSKNMSDPQEAQNRKERSITILKEENVPFIDHLPLIVNESESTRRTTEEVAIRAMALCIVSAKGEGLDQETVNHLIADFQLADAFTPKENAFIADPNPDQHTKTQFVWRYEDYWVLLWALGFVDTLERPDHICDVKKAIPFLRDNGRDRFLKKAKLRPQSELLDAADLTYRYHWAVVNARVKKETVPAKLDSGVVMERHYVLNWLIQSGNQDWDDISTDT